VSVGIPALPLFCLGLLIGFLAFLFCSNIHCIHWFVFAGWRSIVGFVLGGVAGICGIPTAVVVGLLLSSGGLLWGGIPWGRGSAVVVSEAGIPLGHPLGGGSVVGLCTCGSVFVWGESPLVACCLGFVSLFRCGSGLVVAGSGFRGVCLLCWVRAGV